VQKDSSYAEVESVKAVSDVIAPMSGEIVAINDALEDKPELINTDPYGEGWLIKVKLSSPEEFQQLLGAAEYRKLLES
jgi:glycine cleavage system H protein